MIAPLRQTECEPPSSNLQRARRAVASMLFEPETDRPAAPRAWSKGKSWLFVLWIIVVFATYAAFML